VVTALTVVHLLFALGLIVGVLMQSGKSAGLSGAITGGAAERIFGKRKGLDVVLTRWTTVLAVGFMLSAFVLTVLRS
jgi:preprotein translocase subunit SecG